MTGRGRVDQHQYIAVFDHGAEVVREHELPVDVVVRLDKIDGFAGIQAADTRGGKLAGQIGADVFRTLQAQERVHTDRAKVESDAARRFKRHGHIVLDFGHIDIIIDVRMVCGEMPGDRIRVKAFVGMGDDSDRLLHKETTFLATI